MTREVAVLMGGVSAERAVSLVSGGAVVQALDELGYRVRGIDVGHDVRALVEALTPAPDAVFNALHGRYGEDGCIQGLLDLMGIPYTHSGLVASALAMDKPMAKRVFAQAGLPCPEGMVVERARLAQGPVMDPPYVVKPVNEGSSVGVHIVRGGENAPPLPPDWAFGDRVLVERYIPGREITVAVMGGRALGALEIRPTGRFYDYQSKYTQGYSEHLVPAPLPPADYAAALDIASQAHAALGCRGVSRADLRYDDTAAAGRLFLLEVNTQPGMTPLSLVPEIAAHAGIPFNALVRWMVEAAECDA